MFNTNLFYSSLFATAIELGKHSFLKLHLKSIKAYKSTVYIHLTFNSFIDLASHSHQPLAPLVPFTVIIYRQRAKTSLCEVCRDRGQLGWMWYSILQDGTWKLDAQVSAPEHEMINIVLVFGSNLLMHSVNPMKF